MAKPNSTSWISGTPIIMPKVRRSRRIWMNSFTTMAQRRDIENLRGVLMTQNCPAPDP